MTGEKIRLVQKKVPIGSTISVQLADASITRGVLIELGETHITIRSVAGEQTILEDLIGGWTNEGVRACSESS
jgi:hypothetical protein